MTLTAALLAGGKGSRVAHEGVAKALIDVAGRPFILYVIDALRAGGIDQIILLVGYKAKHIVDVTWGRVDGYVVDPPTASGTGGAVKGALWHLPEAFFILNADTVLETAFTAYATSTMLVMRQPGNVTCQGDVVTAYDKGVTDREYVDCGGFYRVADFADTPATFDMEIVIKRMVERGALNAQEIDGPMWHIGTTTDLEATRRHYELLRKSDRRHR